MEHDKCYVFARQPPSKKRRVEKASHGLGSSLPLRRKLYSDLWNERRRHIEDVFYQADQETVDDVAKFLLEIKQDDGPQDRIPAGFVLAGPSMAAHTSTFQRIQQYVESSHSRRFVSVSSTDGPNMKTLLKLIIKKALSQTSSDDDNEIIKARQGGRKLLDYDLVLLQRLVLEKNLDQVVVAFRDVEAFDSNILSESIELFKIWMRRIPFVLFFGVATSIQNLQDRVSKSASRCLTGTQFNISQADDVSDAILTATTVGKGPRLRLGPGLCSMLLQRHQENLLSPQDFVDELQYAYMSHFYANPLSIFLARDLNLEYISEDHVEALRNVPSFQKYAQDLLAMPIPNGPRKLRAALNSSDAMIEIAQEATQAIQEIMSSLWEVVQLIRVLARQVCNKELTVSSLYLKAITGKLHDSPVIREILLSLSKLDSDVLTHVFDQIHILSPMPWSEEWNSLKHELSELLKQQTDSRPMRSEHDIHNGTLRTTVVAQKIQLSRHKQQLSEQDAEYSRIVTALHDHLLAVFGNLQSPMDMPFHEIVIYDLKTPHRAALMPRPRSAIERALVSSHDYLNCSCCGTTTKASTNAETTLSGSLPPTALLYQLYLESGALINVNDLHSAFAAILAGDHGDVEETVKIMPLFQRALAELKYLGLVKATRKKTDHISKVAWKGL